MSFIADLHIHSRFSLATSRFLDIPHLVEWAMRKGIDVLGTGDITHPAWQNELREWLQEDEDSGLFAPAKSKFALSNQSKHPLFCLQGEISCVYKRSGKTRKVHNLVFLPDFESARKFSQELAKTGSITSDGRPVLRLDSRNLLEILLESSEDAVLVPAHIWTPWYSLFGSKSGFDAIEECYGDLSGHIFALETGLSSDPAMNRRLSCLDKYALVSNSDAHSGQNLGREANMFSGKPSWHGIFKALRKSAERRQQNDLPCCFLGTMEFYPEEGKYHLDGHRQCNVCLAPEESAELNNICPVCKKPVTIGVLNRVYQLADRIAPANLQNEPEARMLVPLIMILAQIHGISQTSVKVQREYEKTIAALGPELDILCNIPIKDIYGLWEPLGEAVNRVRTGTIMLNAGFDGQYGTVEIFKPFELAEIRRK